MREGEQVVAQQEILLGEGKRGNVRASGIGSSRELLERKYAARMRENLSLGGLVGYTSNKKVPILRLYRYKEAFAFALVNHLLDAFGVDKKDVVFDPFCGMGTTLLASRVRSYDSIGVDKLPIAVFIARTLPLVAALEPGSLWSAFHELKEQAKKAEPAVVADDVRIMKIAFHPNTMMCLRKWKSAIDQLNDPLRDVFLLLFFSVLERCSHTSKDGQFLRYVPDKQTVAPAEALEEAVREAEKDVRVVRELGWDLTSAGSVVCEGDTRDLSSVKFSVQPSALITSPPYANRYDYTRTYSLELCFHFVKNFEELRTLRFNVLRLHIESKIAEHEEPPHPAAAEVVSALRATPDRLNNPRIPDMLTTYFVDMSKTINEWSRVLAGGAKVAVVVDNVRFEGHMVPVDLILSDLAESAGFVVKEILVARYKGNSSQQMGRYGRIPVRESIVLWEKT